MTIDGQRVERTVTGAWDRARQWDKEINQVFGQPPGARNVTGEAEAFWFERQAAMNPDWVRALPYVKGGREMATRYMRRRGM